MGNKLQVYRGDSKTYNLTFKNSSAEAINLASCTIFFTVKENQNDTDAQSKIQKKIISHSSAYGGLSNIELGTTDTSLSVKSYYYDIQLKDATGKITTIVKDTFEILRDITISTV